MNKVTSKGTTKPVRRSRPALTPEAKENQMIAKAVNLAEQQLDDGTASSQIIVHYLKLGTVKAQLELEKIRKENKLLEVKADSIKSGEHGKEMYEKALRAFKGYSGQGDDDDYL